MGGLLGREVDPVKVDRGAFWGSDPSLQARFLWTQPEGETAPSIGAGGRAAATAPRATARVDAGRYA